MKMAKISDHWRHVYSRDYNINILNVNMGNQYGINEIILSKGIYTVCGLNGAGKTTVLTFLKDILGIPITKEDITTI